MKVEFQMTVSTKNDWGWGNKQLTAGNVLSLTIV